MSFNFGNFSLRKKTTFIENKKEEQEKQKEAEDKAKKNRSKATKLHPLANAITDTYVDDVSLYRPKITREDRYSSWRELVQLNKKYKKPKRMFSSDERFLFELNQYPSIYYRIFQFISTSFWDQLYLNMFFLFLLLLFLTSDRYGRTIAPSIVAYNTGNQLLLLPLLFMFFSQCIPFFGTIFYIHFCYDLVNLLATRDFANWSFICCLMSQYIQFFSYSGKGKQSHAGTCKHGQRANLRKLKEKLVLAWDSIPFPGKSAKIDLLEDDEENEEDKDDYDVESGKYTTETQSQKLSEKPKVKRKMTNKWDSERKRSVLIKAPKKRVEDKKGGGLDLNALLKKRKRTTEDGEEEEIDDEVADAREKARLAYEDELAHPEDYIDWTCIVCNSPNHARQFIKEENINVDIVFGMRGIQFKSLYAKMIWESKSTKCKKCYTSYDYSPPEATAHLFPHNPKPYVAFADYPPAPRIQYGLKIDDTSKWKAYLYSLFYGLTSNEKSKVMYNDWKLKKYVTHEFPPFLRYSLKDGKEMYEVGEIIECKQQKLEYYRAKIIDVHPINNTYDIKYDQGDELRFVPFKNIRLRPEKRSFAYRIELTMVLFILYFPLGIILSMMSGNFGLVFLCLLLTSLGLFCVKLTSLIQYCYNFYDSGILVILRLSSFYTLPIFFLMITSMIGISSASNVEGWSGLVALFILTMISAIPVIYAIRAAYVVIAGIVFLQASVGLILLPTYGQHINDPTVTIKYWKSLDGIVHERIINHPPTLAASLIVPLIPFLTLIITFKFLRRHLHNIWDVCFVIRPLINTDQANPYIGGIFYNKLKIYMGY
jgi:hypothetical protein